jgi:hypothetical protein
VGRGVPPPDIRKETLGVKWKTQEPLELPLFCGFRI